MTDDTTEEAIAEACGIAEELGSSAEAVRAHLAQLPARYAAVVDPRAIVRHTIMAATRPGPAEARTRVTPGTPDGADDSGFDQLDVVALDHPGWFARVAGVLCLQGGDIVSADAFARADGLAVDTFRVRQRADAVGSWWARVEGDLHEAAAGRLAIRARVKQAVGQERAIDDITTRIEARTDPDADLTEIEVRAPDRAGLLYAIAAALAELQIDIVTARVDTIALEAVDVFVCRNAHGSAIDEHHRHEVELAIRAAIDELNRDAA